MKFPFTFFDNYNLLKIYYFNIGRFKSVIFIYICTNMCIYNRILYKTNNSRIEMCSSPLSEHRANSGHSIKINTDDETPIVNFAKCCRTFPKVPNKATSKHWGAVSWVGNVSLCQPQLLVLLSVVIVANVICIHFIKQTISVLCTQPKSQTNWYSHKYSNIFMAVCINTSNGQSSKGHVCVCMCGRVCVGVFVVF